MSWRERLLVFLAAFGVVISAYLLQKTADPSSVVCSVGGGCEAVLSSPYAKITGVPVATLGLIWYLGQLLLIWNVLIRPRWNHAFYTYWLVGGLAFSLYLLYLETFVIHAYCTWCLVSLGLVALTIIISSVRVKRNV